MTKVIQTRKWAIISLMSSYWMNCVFKLCLTLDLLPTTGRRCSSLYACMCTWGIWGWMVQSVNSFEFRQHDTWFSGRAGLYTQRMWERQAGFNKQTGSKWLTFSKNNPGTLRWADELKTCGHRLLLFLFHLDFYSVSLSACASSQSQGMPRELTQNRIQKIWVPTKDGKPAPRRGKPLFNTYHHP